ncbi:phage tail protein [Lysobacter sp. CA196]|uniref:phage tail protein n=1 Tax=Lysobacter sp. CA196 TaxID=3455606 RepID=UPI003F8D0155
MYAVLGDIAFEAPATVQALDTQAGAEFAEHALIGGKPRLQHTGARLDEQALRMAFHAHFCDPAAELVKLRAALTAHEALALVLGSGEFMGWYVLTDLRITRQHALGDGTLVSADAEATLREFTGDPARPLQPPAVRPSLPPTTAVQAATAPLVQGATGVTAVRQAMTSAVSLATQARSALRVAGDAARFASSLRSNPLAALGQLPGLSRALQQAEPALAGGANAFGRLTDATTDAAPVLSALQVAQAAVQNARSALDGRIDVGNVAGTVDVAVGLLGSASAAMDGAAPNLNAIAARLIVRGP